MKLKIMEIAIIAHDRKKADMVQFLNKNKNLLLKENIKIIATGTTGGRAEAAGFKVKKMLSGPLGGDAQIAARVAIGKTKMVLFFKDPNSSHAHLCTGAANGRHSAVIDAGLLDQVQPLVLHAAAFVVEHQ